MSEKYVIWDKELFNSNSLMRSLAVVLGGLIDWIRGESYLLVGCCKSDCENFFRIFKKNINFIIIDDNNKDARIAVDENGMYDFYYTNLRDVIAIVF